MIKKMIKSLPNDMDLGREFRRCVNNNIIIGDNKTYIDVVKKNPNDMDLGEKIRKLFR